MSVVGGKFACETFVNQTLLRRLLPPVELTLIPNRPPGHCNVVHENKQRSCKFSASSSNSNCFTWCDFILPDKTLILWENEFNATEKFYYDIVRYKGIVCSHQFMEEFMNGSLFIKPTLGTSEMIIFNVGCKKSDRFVCVLWE